MGLIELHDAFVRESRQSIWEDRHRLPLTKALRAEDPYLNFVYNARIRRRIRVNQSWSHVLEVVLQGIAQGHCDLDILLDPYLWHMAPTRGLTRWYPGAGRVATTSDLLMCLRPDDAASPWRINYRNRVGRNPSCAIKRLPGKFSLPTIPV